MNEVKEKGFSIEQAYSILVPWWGDNRENSSIALRTEDSAQRILGKAYLFPITEITIGSSTENIQEFLNSRYQTILAASYSAGLNVATIIKGEKGKIKVFLGFWTGDKDNQKPQYFQALLNGILPGEKIKFDESCNISSLIDKLPNGGVVTGIPSMRTGDKDQYFNFSSVIRSMYGREYVLIIAASPISRPVMQDRLLALLSFRDKCHELAKFTEGKEEGDGVSISVNENKIFGTSISKGHSVGATAGFGIPVGPVIFGSGGTYSYNWSKVTSESSNKGTSETLLKNESKSFSREIQNGLAMELEEITQSFIERMMQGFNTGFWETTVTFAAQDQISCDILGGSFIGELSKPSEKLYPARLYVANIDKDKLLFLPKTDTNNPIFPKSLCSYITSQELAQLSAPPSESLPGYEIKRMPALALTDSAPTGEIILGPIADYGSPIDSSLMSLSKKDLNKHLFVCGLTGSGKTTTVKHILKSITKNNNPIPFLVLESAKRDYRQLLADNAFMEKLNIFTIGDSRVSPIRFNPFYVQYGVHPLVHIDYLKAIFNASFSLYGPMPHIVEKCLHNIYLKRNWDLTTGYHPHFVDQNGYYTEEAYKQHEHYYYFPTLSDLRQEVDNYVKNKLEYKGELQDNIRTAIIARIDSLSVGAKGLMFNTYDFYPMQELLNKSTIFEMENLADDDDKAFFVGLVLVLISEYRQKDNPAVNPGSKNEGLQHFLVIEEAHRLLKNVSTERTSEMMGNPKGKAVEVFCNVISEMRSLGQGVAVVEQIPTKISPDVIKNSNTKIVHRIVSKDDQSILAGSLSISDEDTLYLNRLKTGHALCHKEGMERPVECKIHTDVKTYAISDDTIKRIMESNNFSLHCLEAYELTNILGKEGREIVLQFFNSLCSLNSNTIEGLATLLIAKLKKLSLLKNCQELKNNIYIDYTVKSLMEILSKGIYSKRANFPEGLKENLVDLITKDNLSVHKKVMESFKIFWEEEPQKYISEIVLNLSIKYLASDLSGLSQEKVNKMVEKFFLLLDRVITKQISSNVVEKLGGQND
ncbi:MAG: ATP-binding protein [Dehalobacter sp. 4CP]|nr:ATP-binding protein [Dehalobacter sp. 4CP]